MSSSKINGLDTTLAAKANATDLDTRVATTGGGKEAVAIVGASGVSQTINITTANVHQITLTANCTFALSGATAGTACSVTLILVQDNTGNRAVTWPASVKWAGGAAPTLSPGGSKIDIVSFMTINGGTNWFGFVSGQNF